MKKAFTLAEVLITLGVIGVISAITLPNLLSAYHRHVVETRLKSVYSTILQGFRMYQAQYGDFTLEDLSGYSDVDQNVFSYEKSKATFEKYFAPVFVGATLYSKGSRFDAYSADGSAKLSEAGNYTVYYNLADGTILGLVKAGGYDGVVIDIIFSPQKSRPRTGLDFFKMTFRQDQSGNYVYNSPASRNYSSKNRKQFIENCKSNIAYPQYSSQPSDFCTALIVKNGFKIPSDYPIKF